MKRIEITFSDTHITYTLIDGDMHKCLAEMPKMADVEYDTIGDQYAEEYGIDDVVYSYE